MIYGDIFQQKLQFVTPHIVAGTINYLEIKFLFRTNDWEGFEKWVHFSNGDSTYDILLTDDCVRKEDHLNLSEGEWKVFLHGNKYIEGTVAERITTETALLNVIPTGMWNGEPFPEIPVSLTERLLARLNLLESHMKSEDTETLLGEVRNLNDLKQILAAGYNPISLASDADIMVSQTLDLPEGTVILGNGATIRRAAGFEAGLFNLSSGCRIENFTIEGNRSAMVNPKWDKTYEVNMKTDAQGCVIENITINNGNEGIIVSGYDNIVRGCRLYNCGGNGIRFGSAYRCIAEDCTIIGANKNASSMGNSHGCIYVCMYVKTVDIVNCYCEDGFTGLGGLDASDKEHIKVIGCTFVGCTNAIEAKHVGETSPFDIVFSNNQFIENGTFNITTSRKDTSQIEGLIISDNTFVDTPLLIEGTRAAILRGNAFRFREFTGQGVQVKRSPHIVIEGNSVDSPNNIAVAIERCSAANILGNTIRYKTNAVNVSDSIGAAISNNIMRQVANGGTGSAIHFNSSPEAAMDYNRIYTYSGNGIVVVNNTRATGNYIIVADSSQIAIRVWGGYKNYLVAQNMSNGTYAIATAGSAVVQNNVTIESTAFKDVTFTLTNITSDGIAKCLTDDDYVCTLTAADGYTLPDTITVTMNGTALASGTGYAYDKAMGKVTVYRVSGAVTVTGDAA